MGYVYGQNEIVDDLVRSMIAEMDNNPDTSYNKDSLESLANFINRVAMGEQASEIDIDDAVETTLRIKDNS